MTWLPQWSAGQTRLVAIEQNTRPRTDPGQPVAPNSTPTIVVSPSPAAVYADPAEKVARHPQTPAATAIEAAIAVSNHVPWLAIAWAAGGLLSLIPLALGLWQLAALHRHSRVVDDQGWLLLLGELQRQAPVRRSVQLRQSEKTQVPLTWGALRPVLLVPAEAVFQIFETR